MSVPIERYHPETCIGCKSCTKVCPSARNGGIIPDECIASVNEGGEPRDIWKCLQCHRCSDACPKGIQVSELILEFRNASADKPDRFRKSFDTFLKNGRTIPSSDMIKTNRNQLGLEDDSVSAETLSRIQKSAGGKK